MAHGFQWSAASQVPWRNLTDISFAGLGHAAWANGDPRTGPRIGNPNSRVGMWEFTYLSPIVFLRYSWGSPLGLPNPLPLWTISRARDALGCGKSPEIDSVPPGVFIGVSWKLCLDTDEAPNILEHLRAWVMSSRVSLRWNFFRPLQGLG